MTDTTMTCSRCSSTVRAEARFCNTCGAPAPGRAPADASHVDQAPTMTVDMPATAAAATGAHEPSRATSPQRSSFAQPSVPAYSSTAGYGAEGYSRSSADEDGVVLLPNEKVLHDISFSPKLLAPHLKSRMVITDKRVLVRHPHTIFGLIPLGYASGAIRHSAIEEIASGVMMRSRMVLGGVVALVLALVIALPGSAGGHTIIAFFAFVVAIVCFATARSVGIVVRAAGGHLACSARGTELSRVQLTALVLNKCLISEESSRSIDV